MTSRENQLQGHPLPRIAEYFVLIFLMIACSGATGAQAVPEPSPTWLTSDPATKSVKLLVISSYNSVNAGFNFNGYESGKMVVSVPEGWQVTVDCKIKGNGNHSCAIVKNAGDQTPAFPGATTPDPVHGFPNGGTQSFTFKTANPGTYRISCLVPGHDDSGMWDTFIVTAGGEPSIKLG